MTSHLESEQAVGTLADYLFLASDLQQSCRSLHGVHGAQKLERKIAAEIKFLNSLSRRDMSSQTAHLQSSNLSHYAALVHAATHLPSVTHVLKPFSCPGRDDSLLVDVVAFEGHAWVKVVARKGQALHLVWAGQGQFGERDMVQQIGEYQKCATHHPVTFRPPRVHITFYNTFTIPMADAFTHMGVELWGEVVPVHPTVTRQLSAVVGEDDDDNVKFIGNFDDCGLDAVSRQLCRVSLDDDDVLSLGAGNDLVTDGECDASTSVAHHVHEAVRFPCIYGGVERLDHREGLVCTEDLAYIDTNVRQSENGSSPSRQKSFPHHNPRDFSAQLKWPVRTEAECICSMKECDCLCHKDTVETEITFSGQSKLPACADINPLVHAVTGTVCMRKGVNLHTAVERTRVERDCTYHAFKTPAMSRKDCNCSCPELLKGAIFRTACDSSCHNPLGNRLDVVREIIEKTSALCCDELLGSKSKITSDLCCDTLELGADISREKRGKAGTTGGREAVRGYPVQGSRTDTLSVSANSEREPARSAMDPSPYNPVRLRTRDGSSYGLLSSARDIDCHEPLRPHGLMTVYASCRHQGHADASREERDVVSVTGEYGVGAADIGAGIHASTPDGVINVHNDCSLTSDANKSQSADADVSRSSDVDVQCALFSRRSDDDCSRSAHDFKSPTSHCGDSLFCPFDSSMTSKEVYPHHYMHSSLSANLSSHHRPQPFPCKLHSRSDAISCDELMTCAKASAPSVGVSAVSNDLVPDRQSPYDAIPPSRAKSSPETGALGNPLISPLVHAPSGTVNCASGCMHKGVKSQQGSASAELIDTNGSLKSRIPDDVISSYTANPRSHVSFLHDVNEPSLEANTPDGAILSVVAPPRLQISSSDVSPFVSVNPFFQSCSDVNPAISMMPNPQTSTKADVHTKRVVRSKSWRVSQRLHPCLSRLLSHPPDFTAFRNRADGDGDGDLGSEVTKVNLDITTLITLVSSVCHGGGCMFRFPDKVLDQQAAEERTSPVLPDLQKYLNGKRLLVCRTALEDFQTILNLLGGPVERQRAAELLNAVEVVQDQLSERAADLQAIGKVKDRSKTIFGTGDALQAITVTANSGFIRAAKNQGVTFAVYLHPARALTERKEKTATFL